MNSKPNASGNDLVYEDYEPPSEWVAEEPSYTLVVFLPGFTKQKPRVQITVHGKVKIFGEHHVSGNKWKRFSKEFPIPLDSNTDQITANFESGVLYIKVPKAIPAKIETLQEQIKKPTEEPTRPQKPPSDESQTQKKGLEEKVEQKKPSDVKENTSDTNEIKEVTNDFVKDFDEKRLKNEKIGKGEGETKEMNDTAMCCNLRSQGSKEGVKSLVNETKNKRLINLIVAVSLLLVIGFYVKYGIFKSKGESNRTEL